MPGNPFNDEEFINYHTLLVKDTVIRNITGVSGGLFYLYVSAGNITFQNTILEDISAD